MDSDSWFFVLQFTINVNVNVLMSINVNCETKIKINKYNKWLSWLFALSETLFLLFIN